MGLGTYCKLVEKTVFQYLNIVRSSLICTVNYEGLDGNRVGVGVVL